MLLGDFIRESSKALASVYPEREARNMVLILCEERLGVKSYTHIVEPRKEIPEDMESVLTSDINRLLGEEPLQYVLGRADFCGRKFKVDRNVLIPRPETEQLVAEVEKTSQSKRSGVRVLDLCTGSGCIAWTLFKDLPSAEVVAVDISGQALDIARNQFDGPSPVFIKADILDGNHDYGEGGFDIIVSNPPYIMEREKSRMRGNVLDHEPALALFVPDSDPLLFYRAIASAAKDVLSPDGICIVEINELLGDETQALFERSGFRSVKQIPDIFNKIRFISFSR